MFRAVKLYERIQLSIEAVVADVGMNFIAKVVESSQKGAVWVDF